jgi:hypothetical protein
MGYQIVMRTEKDGQEFKESFPETDGRQEGRQAGRETDKKEQNTHAAVTTSQSFLPSRSTVFYSVFSL